MNIEKFKSFDYNVAIVSRNIGDNYGIIVGSEKSRSSLGAYTLYTKGLICGVELKTNTPTLNRSVGTFSLNLNDIVPGRYVFSVIENSEQYCIDIIGNLEKFPSNVYTLDIKENESIKLNKNLKVLVCLGNGWYGDLNLSPKISFISNDVDTITANSRILAMVIED